MNETSPRGASGSERVASFLGRLHPVTQVLAVAAAVHIIATLIGIGFSLANPTIAMQTRPLGLRLAEHARSIAYSIGFIGSAASVEFLFRIWTELRLSRKPD